MRKVNELIFPTIQSSSRRLLMTKPLHRRRTHAWRHQLQCICCKIALVGKQTNKTLPLTIVLQNSDYAPFKRVSKLWLCAIQTRVSAKERRLIKLYFDSREHVYSCYRLKLNDKCPTNAFDKANVFSSETSDARSVS